MAELVGPLKYLGSFKDIRHYKLPGSSKIYAATKSVVPKTIRDNNPAFKKTRAQNFEFAGRTKFAKDIHEAMGEWSLPIVNRYFQGKMTAIMNDVMDLDPNILRGHRNIYLSQYKHLLYLLDAYHYYKPLSEVFRCPYTIVDEGNRNTVTVVIKGLYPLRQIKGPDKASHFQIYLSIGCVKDYIYNAEWNSYGSYDLRGGYKRDETHSDWIPIDNGLMEDITLTISLPKAHVPTDTETVVRSFGIVYGRMTAEVIPLKKDRGSIAFLGAV
jgi:hypothetical protein